MILLKIFKSIAVELLLIFVLILTYNNYIGNSDITIKADGKGYYDYLPSVFIHKDLVRKDFSRVGNSPVYQRVGKMPVYVPFKSRLVNKYSVGTSLLISPFFAWTYLHESHRSNGQPDQYSRPLQISVFHAAIFYLFFSLWFLKKILKLYNIKPPIIILSQILLTFATGVPHYAGFDASFSHIYSLFAITAFIYFTKRYFTTGKALNFLPASVFLALVILIRPFNALIVLFVPFLAGSVNELKSGILRIVTPPPALIGSVLIFAAIVSIQCIAWYLQTGTFILYSYQHEGFNFSSPEIFNTLFSYRKGLFVYTPVLFICLFGLIRLAVDGRYYLALTWLFFFATITYFISSWWCWYYGGSFGMRAFIDYYPVFFILFALLLDNLQPGIKIPVIILSLCTIPVNLIQTKQYKDFILHWSEMDREKYWKVFLKQDDEYKGLLWKRTYTYGQYDTAFQMNMEKKEILPEKTDTVFLLSSNNIQHFDKVNIIQVKFENDFDKNEKTRLLLAIIDTAGRKVLYNYNPPLIHFADSNLNKYQSGHFDYEFSPLTGDSPKIVALKAISGQRKVSLKNISVSFLMKK